LNPKGTYKGSGKFFRSQCLDTARWEAYFGARETHRSGPLFRDPFAERLAGERGFQIANAWSQGNRLEWARVARAYLFDQFISHEISDGADPVVNRAFARATANRTFGNQRVVVAISTVGFTILSAST